MAAQFGSKPDLAKLNDFLLDKSYVSGWDISAEDVAVFNAVGAAPAASFVNALRWWNHVNSYKSEFGNLGAPAAAAKNDDDDDEDDDDMDFFGSDDEEEDAEAERIKAERVAAYNAKKAEKVAKKGATIAKSMITLDVKPFDDETDLDKLAVEIKKIAMDGLVWGNKHEKKPLAYGIFKLVVTAVVEDEKVSTDDLVEQIEAFEDEVQSVDIAAFNKL
jgi:elongation factor 1-beta